MSVNNSKSNSKRSSATKRSSAGALAFASAFTGPGSGSGISASASGSAPSSCTNTTNANTRNSLNKKDAAANSISNNETDDSAAESTSSVRAPPSSPLQNTLMIGLGICCLLSVSANFLHAETFSHHAPENSAVALHLKDFKRHALRSKSKTKAQLEAQKQHDNHVQFLKEEHGLEGDADADADADEAALGWDPEGQHEVNVDAEAIRNPSLGLPLPLPLPASKIGSLDCSALSKEESLEMVYWHDIPSDAQYVSPLKAKRGERRQYLTFEPDGGGWNNIRMAMETIVGLAIAMGRTLVLPPAQGMYLLKKDKTKQNTDFDFADFFPMHEMAQEHAGLDMITMQQFLETEAMTGQLLDTNSGLPSFPPDNRTNWDGQDVKVLKEWMRNVTFIDHMWKPGQCLAAFPASGNHKDVELLQNLFSEGSVEKSDKFKGHPVDVDAPPMERLHENMAGRKELCVYDEQMQSKLVVHFMCYHKMRIRYLVHFYAFLFFEDWRQDLWMKRFMRDHMRYIDEIQCAAASIVTAVRQRARERGWKDGNFDTFHIRRGDFQFKDTRIDAKEILQNSKDVLTVNKTLFIATDERDKKFFDPIKQGGYDVLFLDDFKDILKGVNTNYYGMIDQLVASKGDVFLGCWHSTFTGFIMRMRGYHSTKRQLDGNLDGNLPTTYYYATTKNKYVMHEYAPLFGGFFNREFPTSWRQIDKSVDQMPHHGAITA